MSKRTITTKNHFDGSTTVPVTMPTDVWAKLAVVADRADARVADVIADAIRGLVYVGRPATFTEAQRRALDAVAGGWDDWTIAEQLGVPLRMVAQWRHEAGMKPCPPGRGHGQI
ncbi:hypothetical protein EG850_11120 [Gulosibacter macacae]|uniref:Uncharacterized protein n=1 Tax=Gulosibacter macacae TaxID=2488791 RepID=A0A3P3VWU5_9MICO|nr:hypothetical protein [Gulosibacter macacae]RRJ85929.1 hypothetical protein EG850_11120 [Gulosibacter macacae]